MNNEQPNTRFNESAAILAVPDVKAAVAYYRDVLGFGSEWFWGNPPTFAGMRRDCVSVMFNQQPGIAAHIDGHQHWFNITGIDTLYAEHKRKGATIVDDLAPRPWGVREYVVRDLNGYRLRFGEDTE